jgi:peptidyl-prolyl cis-trans isomerase SurA
MRKTLISGLLACTLWIGPARAELLDRVAAVVNSDVITLAEVQQRAAPLLDAAAKEPIGRREAAVQEAMRHSLDELIGEKLMDLELKSLSVDVTEGEVDLAVEDVKKNNNIPDQATFEQALAGQGFTLSSYKEFMRKQLAKVKLLQIKVKAKVKVSDEDVKAAYAQSSKLDSQDIEIHARHILVQVAATALEPEVETARAHAADLAKQARQPGADFVALAKATSQGPSAADGGDLGWFRRGTMVAEFENVAFRLKPGEVSDPVRTKFGFHVITVQETRKGQGKPFDEVKEQLRDRLYRESVERQTAAYISDLRRAAAIDVKIPELKMPEREKTGADQVFDKSQLAAPRPLKATDRPPAPLPEK